MGMAQLRARLGFDGRLFAAADMPRAFRASGARDSKPCVCLVVDREMAFTGGELARRHRPTLGRGQLHL